MKEAELKKTPVKKLKEILKSHDLPQSGRKAELVQRLNDFYTKLDEISEEDEETVTQEENDAKKSEEKEKMEESKGIKIDSRKPINNHPKDASNSSSNHSEASEPEKPSEEDTKSSKSEVSEGDSEKSEVPTENKEDKEKPKEHKENKTIERESIVVSGKSGDGSPDTEKVHRTEKNQQKKRPREITSNDESRSPVAKRNAVKRKETIKVTTKVDTNAQTKPDNSKGEAPPSKLEATSTLRIDNFLRPFTLPSVKKLVQRKGEYVEDGFWMDRIKTHCYVTYPNIDIAIATRNELYNLVWPEIGGKALVAEFSSKSAKEVAEVGGLNNNKTVGPKDEIKRRNEKPPVTIDELFRKTNTKPFLYYLPLTDQQVEMKKQRSIRAKR